MTAIQGRGAFGRFKDAIYRISLQDRWHQFKGREDRKLALEWLRSLDLITDHDKEKGLQLYEKWLAKQNQRKKDLANMTKGAQVNCNDVAGHEDKLTPGKTYEVLAEKQDQPEIRIRDDREKECWFPKSHFALVRVKKN